MKVAVIGCGTIANSAHIPAYMANKDAEIKYFCDIIKERAEKAVEKYGCGIAVVDYHDVLNDPEIQAVSVCTPNNVHAEIAIAALEAGKNVLCEKPAARVYEDALKMQEAILKIPGVKGCEVSFIKQKMTLEAEDAEFDKIVKQAVKAIAKVEPDCTVVL